ncbi:MAG: hypothetical protein IT204_15565 [Fimbriimonadaceae bacterium]|nr:hypothetical protein [Fimbriimonadaceae bacterium]
MIDADVLRAAGGAATTAERSVACREFLEAVRRICHRAVYTLDLLAEWDRSPSLYASTWRMAMQRRSKSRAVVAGEAVADLPDRHLVEAAITADWRVVSCDERARNAWSQAVDGNPELAALIWVNPTEPSEHAIEWLAAGAPPEQHRTLGARWDKLRRAGRSG